MCPLLHHRDTCKPSDAAHHIFPCILRHTPSEIIMFCHESMKRDGEKFKQKVVEADTEDQEQRSCLTTQLHKKKYFHMQHLCCVWSVDYIQPLCRDEEQHRQLNM